MERKRHRGNKLGFSLTMEQQEETKRKFPKRTTKQSNPTSSFPLDLTSEILLRLPAKSVVRSRCVSKLWSAITTDPYFTNSFKTRHSTRLSVLMFFKTDDKLFVFSTPPDHQNSNESYTSSLPIIDLKEEDSYFFPTESVHGLICFQDSGNPIVWNPSMRQFLTLPIPKESSKHITCFLGYDPTEGKHKVMCMPRYKTCDECRVLTLGSAQESWRTVKTNHRHRPLFYTHGRCINGVVYYEAHLDDLCNIIMTFDVRSEKFGVITLPTNISYGMLRYEGRLAYVVSNLDGGITLWILEDAEKHEWSFKHFLAPFHHYDPNLETLFHFDGITQAGEFIYVPRKPSKTFHILYFNPKRNSFRKTEFADEEFRLSNGLGDRIVDGIHSCPDHIESLMSL